MSLKKRIFRQFGKPTGLLGHMAGWIMAKRPSNVERTAWTVSLLDLTPDHRVLEIGYGPGIGIEIAAKQVSEGLVVGIDHSELMQRQASKRNAEAIRAGQVQLHCASALELPDFDEPFDRIFAVNAAQFWKDDVVVFNRLRDLLASGGVLAIAQQPRNTGATEADTRIYAERMSATLEKVGYTDVRVEYKELKPVPVCCILGRRKL